MLKRSFTAVIERNRTFTADFETEPYEAGWAGEARWFVRVMEIAPQTALSLHAQISPDGLFWCDDEEHRLGRVIGAAGLYSFAMRDFGHWLRLAGHIEGPQPHIKLMIYLALKE